MSVRAADTHVQILHVCLNVADADESVEFYEQLGFEESWSFETEDGRTTNRYVTDGEGTELQFSDAEGEDEFDVGSAWDHLAVGVDDVDATFEDLDHYGAVQDPARNESADAYTAFVKDPDGHVAELIETS